MKLGHIPLLKGERWFPFKKKKKIVIGFASTYNAQNGNWTSKHLYIIAWPADVSPATCGHIGEKIPADIEEASHFKLFVCLFLCLHCLDAATA